MLHCENPETVKITCFEPLLRTMFSFCWHVFTFVFLFSCNFSFLFLLVCTCFFLLKKKKKLHDLNLIIYSIQVEVREGRQGEKKDRLCLAMNMPCYGSGLVGSHFLSLFLILLYFSITINKTFLFYFLLFISHQ
jgi:hypothetical protein